MCTWDLTPILAFRGELTSHHPHFYPGSPAATQDIDIQTARQILPGAFTTGIHMGTWHRPGKPFNASKVHENITYTEDDDKAIDDWVADHVEVSFLGLYFYLNDPGTDTMPEKTTWHSLGTCGTCQLLLLHLEPCADAVTQP